MSKATGAIVVSIAHNRLVRSASNARKTGRDTPAYSVKVANLAASIQAVGLLQNLVVHADGEFFGVDAGETRFDAIALLIERGDLPADYPVPCLVIGADAALAASLTENVQRSAMHPADEFDAFNDLSGQDWTIDRIADAFGVTALVVERRLKLRAAAPALIEEYRANNLTTDQLIALCSTDNHQRQVDAWERARNQSWAREPGNLRRAVMEAEVEVGKDPRVEFIGGVDAYTQAGGKVRADLFAADGAGVVLEDAALLESLVGDKLTERAAELETEGWAWVEVMRNFDYSAYERLGRAPQVQAEMPAETAQNLAALEAELVEVEAAILKLHNVEGDLSEEESARLDQHYERQDELPDLIQELKASCAGYTPAVMAHCGAIVAYSHGDFRIERGLVRAADRAKVAAALEDGQSIRGGRETEAAGRKTGAISEALRCSLLGHRNLAAQFVTASNPTVAKVLLVAKMVTDLRLQSSDAPCDLSVTNGYGTRAHYAITDEDGLTKEKEFAEIGGALIGGLPKDPSDLWDALAALSPAELDTLLAYAVARSVSLATEHKGMSAKLLEALGFDMAAHFEPTAGNYLGRVPKELVIEALEQSDKLAGQDDRDNLLNMKKGALALEAESRLAGSGWVPSVIRTPAIQQGKPKKQPAKRAAK